jgi:hypothetical protein
MGRSANERPNRGITRLLSPLLVAVAAQLGIAAATTGQVNSQVNGQVNGQVRRIAIVLARELPDLPAPISLLDARPPDDGVAGRKFLDWGRRRQRAYRRPARW